MEEILTIEEIRFLKQLAHELKTQDRRGTSKPVIYQISDISVDWNRNREEFDTIMIYLDGDYLESLEEMKNYIKENPEEFDLDYIYYDEEKETLQEVIEGYDVDEIASIFEDNGFDVCYGKYTRELKGAFLTEKSAKEHLELNAHHYDKKAKIYVSYGWRNPVLEKLLNIIEKFE